MALAFDPHPLGASGTLLADLAAGGLSLTLAAGQSARFTDPASTKAYNATIVTNGQLPIFSGVSVNAERVRITALAGSILTITRAQEGTASRAFVAGDQIYGADGPLDFTGIERFFTGNAPAWGDSTSLTEDVGGLGRMRLARSGFVFAGASYNDPTRAGSILQIGDYPQISDGKGSYVGINNAEVFITMDDLPSQVGGGLNYVQLHIVGQNSTKVPTVFALNTNVIATVAGAAAGGNANAAEFDVQNLATAGYGVGVVVGTNLNITVPSSTHAVGLGYALSVDNGSRPTEGGFLTGYRVNGITSDGKGIYFWDADTSHAGMAYGIDMSGVQGGFTVAAIYIPNLGAIKWQNADATAGWFIEESSDNNLYMFAGKAATSLLVIDSTASHIMGQFRADTGLSSLQTSLLLALNNGSGMLYGKQVSVRATTVKKVQLGLPRDGTDSTAALGAFGADSHQNFADGADVSAHFNNAVVPDNPGSGWVLKVAWSSSAADSSKNVVLQLITHVYKDADTAPDSLGTAAVAYPAASAANKIKVTSIALSGTPTAGGTLSTVLFFNRTAVGDDATGSVALWDAWYEYTEESGGSGKMALIVPSS